MGERQPLLPLEAQARDEPPKGSSRHTGKISGQLKSRKAARPDSTAEPDATAEPDSNTEELDDDLVPLSRTVRETVPLEDDPTVPVLTFRFFVLLFLFIVPGAFIDTVNAFRTTSAAYSIFFVQIASHAAGRWMALWPDRLLFGRVRLNSGPWSVKETALVTIAAKSGATGNLATNALALVEVFFGVRVPAAAALLFMWAIVFIGYSYAAIARNVVSYDPQFQWPQLLMQTALLQSQAKGHERQMRVFFACAGLLCCWQFLPEFWFPMLSSVAVLCYAAPHNGTLNFIGLGLGGMGFLNLSFDWANVTSQVMLYPYWVQVIQFLGFVLGAWVLIPLARWSPHVFEFKGGLMSNKLFLANGTLYPTGELITRYGTLNETAYHHYGPVFLGPQRAWNMFFDYAAYCLGLVWVVLFAWGQFQRTGKTHTDRLNKLNNAYAQVPTRWYAAMFAVLACLLLYVQSRNSLFMPWWTCVVALGIGLVIVTPLIWLYALSNFQLPIGTFNELVYGYLVQRLPAKHPGGAAFFGSVAGNAWYRSQFHLELMKLGFYNHLPPRAVFLAQVYGELIGVPINYLTLRWVLATKWDYLTGIASDPLHQWTGQEVTSYHTNAIQYVVLGPRRLFEKYPALPYGFLVGLAGPVAVYCMHRRYPNSVCQFHHWNTTVFFSTMSHFYGNVSTGFLLKFLGGTATMFYAYRYKHTAWKQYNYVVAAALDTGYNLAVLVIFFLALAGITAPHWFGNNEQNIERCFALDA